MNSIKSIRKNSYIDCIKIKHSRIKKGTIERLKLDEYKEEMKEIALLDISDLDKNN
jgi:hypothetical protein